MIDPDDIEIPFERGDLVACAVSPQADDDDDRVFIVLGYDYQRQAAVIVSNLGMIMYASPGYLKTLVQLCMP